VLRMEQVVSAGDRSATHGMAEFGQRRVVSDTAPTILDRLFQWVELVWDASHNVEDMADALSQLQAWRNDLREAIKRSPQQTCPEQVDNWFGRVEKVEAKVTKIQEDHRNRCLCAGSFSPNIFSSYAISRRAVEKRGKVKDLLREYNDTLKNLKSERPPASCIPKPLPAAIVGKTSYLAKVLACIDDDKTWITSICGMAGVGKSELLRCVNNRFLPDDEEEDFKFVIWVDNASSDVKTIQDDIARRLKLDDLGAWEEDDAEGRASPIFNFLKDTSFLVLLDNLASPVSLADIGIPNPKFRRSPCKQRVVLTTRFKAVCGRMGSCSQIDVECLDREESWKLLTAAVGDEVLIKDKRVEGFARQIAWECGGLPIALAKIGGAMATMTQSDDWRRTAAFLQRSQIHRIPGMERGNTALLNHMKESYDHVLSIPTDRECFLCCALWPRGRSINKSDLIDCWIGLGLIREPSLDDAVQKGFAIITYLQEANLLLPGGNARDEVKLQQVVRDMALWIACDCGENDSKWLVQAGVDLGAKHKLVEICQRAAQAERVSLMHNNIQELPPPHSSVSSSCLAVLMLQHNNTFTHVPGAFLRSAPALAYLDLSHTATEQLPEDIGTLEGLEYLNLSFTLLKTLPVGLRNLSRLKHLLLRHTNNLSTIPEGVFRSLTSLKVVDMYPSRYMDWEDRDDDEGEGNEGIASSFEQMDSTSTAFIQFLGITISSFRSAQRLGRLINVCTRRLLLTCFSSPECVILCPSRFEVAMNGFSLLETLQYLSIADCPTLERLVFHGEEDPRKPNKSWCLPKLENLELRGLSKLAAIIWKDMSVSLFLPVLQCIKIENCSRLGNVSWVLGLQNLQHLELRNCTTITSLVEPQDDGQEQPPTFSSLMTLIMVNLTELRSICSPRVSFPWMEVIEVDRCVNLRRLHIKPQARLREIRGTMEWWDALEWDTDSEAKASLYPYFLNTCAE
jgi:Leucine-rich repeat (LRR) protein